MTNPWSKAEIKRQFTPGMKLTLVHRSLSVGAVTAGDCHHLRTVIEVGREDIALRAGEYLGLSVSYIHLPTKANGIQFIPTEGGFQYVTPNLGTLTYRWGHV